MLGAPNLAMPLLKILKLDMCSSFAGRLLLDGGAPLLNQLYLMGCTTNAPISHFTSLSTLHYDLSGAFQSEWEKPLKALSNMPCLTHLKLNMRGTWRWPVSVPAIHNETLRTLCLEAAHVLNLFEVLEHFIAPALQEIGVQVIDNVPFSFPIPFPFAGNGLFGPEAFPSLRKLCFEPPSCGTSRTDMRLLMYIFPEITHVIIHQYWQQNPLHLFRMLHAATLQDDLVPWPHLEALGIDGELSTSEFHIFFTKRAEMGYPIAQLLLAPDKIHQGDTIIRDTKLPVTIGSFTYDSPFHSYQSVCNDVHPDWTYIHTWFPTSSQSSANFISHTMRGCQHSLVEKN